MEVACSLDERAWNQLDPCDIFMGFDNGDFMAIHGNYWDLNYGFNGNEWSLMGYT